MGDQVKRGLDLVVAALALVILCPVMLGTALLVWAMLGPPVLWRQQRPGYLGRPFVLIKFRTMRDLRNADGTLRPDAERLTRLGKVLRALSLDELPQLWNVLRGDMSLVGPRPLLMEYLTLYTSVEARRHDVKPGITGWAQVNGRNAITWPERFALDVYYVDHRNLWLDLKILGLTLLTVLRRRGINQAGTATMERFTGHG